MTVSELIDQLRAMPPDVTVMLWSGWTILNTADWKA
jgi:hypothetical protein